MIKSQPCRPVQLVRVFELQGGNEKCLNCLTLLLTATKATAVGPCLEP
jgi:hypothetical protein